VFFIVDNEDPRESTAIKTHKEVPTASDGGKQKNQADLHPS
jgi:hypothetical protein